MEYIIKFDLPYASVYGDIIGKVKGEEKVYHRDELKVLTEQKDGIPPNIHLETTGCQRTGCMFCMFGLHLEKEPNRFQRMALTHPEQHDFCVNTLGCGRVLDYIGVPYQPVTNERSE